MHPKADCKEGEGQGGCPVRPRGWHGHDGEATGQGHDGATGDRGGAGWVRGRRQSSVRPMGAEPRVPMGREGKRGSEAH